MRVQHCLFLSIAIFFFNTVDAQNKEGTLLFEVRSPGSEKVSYLFGTNHAFSKSFVDQYSVIKEKLTTTDRVILEIDMSIPGNTTDDVIRKRDVLTSWKKYFNAKDLAFVKSILKRDDDVFNRFTPAEVHSALYRYLAIMNCETRKEGDPNGSLDDYIGSLARENDLELTGLESAVQQLSLLNGDVQGMPVKVHKRRLQAVVEKIKKKSTADCAVYKMYEQLEYDFKYEAPCTNALMLTNRNNAWMEVLEDYLAGENCFIAVGLSHLQFSCGLIANLREKGFTITPVSMQ